MARVVCGLDMATNTGVAVGPIGGRPKLFTVDLGEGKSHDERFANALRLAKRLITGGGVSHLAIEAPFKKKIDSTKKITLLIGITTCVRGWAAVNNVPVSIYATSTIDKHFLGAPAATKTRKQANMARCKALGWDPATQDEADAAALWDLACAHLSPSYAAQSGSLFKEGAGSWARTLPAR